MIIKRGLRGKILADQIFNGNKRRISLVLGFFDGVHLGHRKLIEAARECSDFVAVRMFDALPKSEAFLTSTEEKAVLFEQIGVDAVIIDDFSSLRSLSGEDFFRDCVIGAGADVVVCGFNYRFGANASCSVGDLSSFAEKYGAKAVIVPEIRENGNVLSSTEIKNLIREGDVLTASALLGRLYSISSPVCHGKKIGRTIGHPTVNQRPNIGQILPKRGIYSCIAELEVGGERITRGGVCNIGSRPTVSEDENDVTLETYIFDFEGDLYDRNIKISFVERLRGEIRFSSVEDLRKAIERDCEEAKNSLEKYFSEKK